MTYISKQIFTLTLAALLVSAPAIAREDSTDGKSSTLASEKILCQNLSAHQPAAGVAYQPGVDVNGKAVAPADAAGGAQIAVPDYISLPLSVDLAQRLNYQLPAGTEMNAVLGTLSVYKDGRVTFNGQDMRPQAVAMCSGQPVPAVQPDAPAKPQDESSAAPLMLNDDDIAATEPAAGDEMPSTTVKENVPPVKVDYVFQAGKQAGSVAPSITTPYIPPGPPPMATKAEYKLPPQQPPLLYQPQTAPAVPAVP